MRLPRYFVLAFLACLLISCVTMPNTRIKPYRVIVTTDLDASQRPISDLAMVAISSKKVLIYVQWSIPAGKHDYRCIIFDAHDKEVFEDSRVINPTGNFCNTWTWHVFNSNIDAPGQWRFEVYIDGNAYLQRTVLITE